MTKKWKFLKIFGRKKFFFGIDSKCFETYFKTKISKSKIFSHYKIFFGLVVFGQKSEKMTESHEKNYRREKFFRFRYFHSKMRFETFWINSDKKIRPKFFDFVIFCFFSRKTTDFQQKILHGKKFSISRFSVYNTFWNILNRFRPKKNSTKIFWLCHFFTIFGSKITFLTLFNRFFFQKNYTSFKALFYKNSELSLVSLA